jgi:hypothetical protein
MFTIIFAPLLSLLVSVNLSCTFSESILCVNFVAISSARPRHFSKLRPLLVVFSILRLLLRFLPLFNNLTTAIHLVATAIALP